MYINVLEMLEESAERFPKRIAFQDEKRAVSYEETIILAKRIASYIMAHTNCRNCPMAVCIDRNIESILLFLGIVYSGNFYVPLDLSMPRERIACILEDLQPKLCFVTEESKRNEIEGSFLNCISYEECVKTVIAEEELSRARETMIDTQPLYAMYTSGSTGRPKGVLISHRSVLDLTAQFAYTFSFPQHPVFGNQAPFDFDVSVKDIYNSILLGGTVCILPKALFSMPLRLIEYLNRYRINTIIWAVSAMRIVENFKTFAKLTPQYLEWILFSGEVMPVRVLNYWRSHVDATYVNLYGPTEITCNCSYYIVDREFAAGETLPIGKAFRNTKLLLLDETEKLIERADQQGEICVLGSCLALGYYGDKEKTQRAFAQTPLQDCYPERVYHTGDIGYYNERGELMFSSRRDDQIKHMGHRIELGEIEIAIQTVEGVEAAVCIFDTCHEKIVLCCQCREAEQKAAEIKAAIVACLKNKLPKYMWPNRYEFYERLPFNKNGKIDRVLLRETYEGQD